MKYSCREIKKIVPPDELAKTVTEEINRAAAGLRGRKRREFVAWARKWWLDRLTTLSKEKHD
jgi:hypothetical protein